jgi:hypothetical protein
MVLKAAKSTPSPHTPKGVTEALGNTLTVVP